MEPIIDYLKRNLREAGSGRWEGIASQCGVAKSLPRKIAFGDRDNPGIQTVQPLIDYFKEIEAGVRVLPDIQTPAATKVVQPATGSAVQGVANV